LDGSGTTLPVLESRGAFSVISKQPVDAWLAPSGDERGARETSR
jgi:hypothetical protein